MLSDRHVVDITSFLTQDIWWPYRASTVGDDKIPLAGRRDSLRFARLRAGRGGPIQTEGRQSSPSTARR